MKITLILFMFGFGFFNLDAQVVLEKKSIERKSTPVTSQEPLKVRPEIPFAELSERLPSADRYILDLKSLMNYFIDKKIPTDFPLYDKEKSFSYNKRKASKWFKKHRELITEDRKEWLQLK